MEIREYWDERAGSDPTKATTDDVYLRVLERDVLSKKLLELGCDTASKVLDLGCGDGHTIAFLSNQFGCHVLGVDYSPAMIQLAKEQILKTGRSIRVDLLVGDVRDAARLFADREFDFVITDRCLINLETVKDQFDSIRGIAQIVKTGGHYLAVENFEEGNDSLNYLRGLFELPPIPVRWHNKYFKERDFVSEVSQYFKDVQKVDFSSSYYLATRVIYSKLCQINGIHPDYMHPIHQLSTKLPPVGDFSPIKLFVMRK